MTKYNVTIPDEVFAILEWDDDGLPAICAVNQALANFDAKIVFAWHLSVIVQLNALADNGMPTANEKLVIDKIGKQLDGHLKANGNALFLARITWNGTRQLLYRVYDPEVANSFLTDTVNSDRAVRPIKFKMQHDADWAMAEWFLQNWEK